MSLVTEVASDDGFRKYPGLLIALSITASSRENNLVSTVSQTPNFFEECSSKCTSLPVYITRNLHATSLIPQHTEMDRAQTPDFENIYRYE